MNTWETIHDELCDRMGKDREIYIYRSPSNTVDLLLSYIHDLSRRAIPWKEVPHDLQDEIFLRKTEVRKRAITLKAIRRVRITYFDLMEKMLSANLKVLKKDGFDIRPIQRGELIRTHEFNGMATIPLTEEQIAAAPQYDFKLVNDLFTEATTIVDDVRRLSDRYLQG